MEAHKDVNVSPFAHTLNLESARVSPHNARNYIDER